MIMNKVVTSKKEKICYAFGNMGGIGLQHGFLLGFNNRGGKRRSVVVRLIWRL